MHVLANSAVIAEPSAGEPVAEHARLTYIFGAEMTPGTSEAQAVSTFLTEHGALFGSLLQGASATGPEPELRQLLAVTSKNETFTAFAYRQLIRGKEVEGSDIRIKVRRGTLCRVDYASARVAGEPTAGSETPIITAEAAGVFVRLYAGLENLVVQGTPEEVVLRGEGERPDTWCWRVRTKTGEDPNAIYRTYFVDTALPRVMHIRDDQYNCTCRRADLVDTTGTVIGPGTSMASPYLPYQDNSGQIISHLIPNLKVVAKLSSTEVATTYTNDSGEFSFAGATNLDNLSTGFVNPAVSGSWYFHYAFDYMAASESASPGNNYELELDNGSLSTEHQIGQVNAVVGVKRARDFFTNNISNSVPRLALKTRLSPNNPNNCGGAQLIDLDPDEFHMNFGSSTNTAPERWNCASASVTAHEFGHVALFLVELDPTGNGRFHEGYADSYASILNDDSVFGREHYKDDSPLRDDPTLDDITAACQYSNTSTSGLCNCAGAPHLAGQMLSGVWARIRTALKDEYGASTGLQKARELFASWTLITAGGSGCNTAHPGTFAEVFGLVSGDTDKSIVCNSFAAHNIYPPLDICP